MAHKKGQGSSRNGRDSNSQRLGIKVYGGQTILVWEERGMPWTCRGLRDRGADPRRRSSRPDRRGKRGDAKARWNELIPCL